MIGARAQVVPTCSTAENPIWYLLSVQESASGLSLYCTVEDKYLYARDLATAESELAAQLWRFEAEEDGSVSLVNKSIKGYLNFRYQVTSSQSLAFISTQKQTFNFQARGDKYALRATTMGEEGACYLGLSQSEALKGHFVELAEEYSNKLPVMIGIQIYNDSPFLVSSTGDENWYNLISAKSGVAGQQAIGENTQANGGAPLIVSALEETNEAQQWMIYRKATTGKYLLINRATGHHILPNSVVVDNYNLTEVGVSDGDSGFGIDYLGLGQYSFCGLEDDGVARYLSIQETSAPVEVLNLSAMNSSSCAWTLRLAGHSTAIKDAQGGKVKVKVVDCRIVVEGTADYLILNTLGMHMPKSSSLPKGI
ncbi:MAG: hypothetical protein ACI4UA_01790, partial [Bacteroidaceae bacterium]